ncbi:MAG: ABC transporter ATP-binding protein [Planctomycetota bacterium]
MKAFRRVFAYVWPQWHRLVTIFCSAILIAMLFSVSVATVLPLLKVMMGEEGLHGWVHRKISDERYGIDFYVQDRVELSDPNNPQAAYYLRVAAVKEGGFAEAAGLRRDDLILGAGSGMVDEQRSKVPSSRLLEELATIDKVRSIGIQYRKFDEEGDSVIVEKELECGDKPFYGAYAEGILRYVPEGQSRESKKNAVIVIILLLAVVTGVRCIARFYQDYMSQKVVNVMLAHIREDAFKHCLEVPVGYFSEEGPSNAISRLIRDTTGIGTGVKIVLGRALREPLKILGLLCVAMLIDRNLTLVFLCAAPAAVYVIAKLGRKIKRATKKSLISWAKMLGKLRESMDGLKVIKVYNQEEREGEAFEVLNRRLLKQQVRIAKVNAAAGPLMETMGMVTGSVCLVFGAQWVYRGTMQASDFFTLLTCLGVMAQSVRQMGSVWNKIQQANAGAERVFQIVDEPVEPEKAGAIELHPLRGRIEFKDVRFSYPGSEIEVLKGVNLSVRAGHKVAIVGPNGSGKTTLANLVPRLYDVDDGQILIDGEDIREATLFSLRNQIAMVTQNVITFNDTIAANIGYGRPGASIEEITDAAKRSYAHEFIYPLPDGYDTIIGEQGSGLSGGQLQRIVIARAILKNPSILIFDEATSQVDADSEAKIHRAIKEIMEGRTSFVIAHRFSTVINADMIVVMDEGRILAQGQHEELMDECPLYQGLYETQLVKA